jgi:putative ABC transport system permease protein
MLSDFLRTTLRRLAKQPGFTFLNVTGLAVGVACCLLIGLYVQHETSYDRFHADADRIVRVIQRTDDGGGYATIGGAVSPILRTEIPQVETVTGVVTSFSPEILTRTDAASGAETTFEEPNFAAATPAFFDVFTGFRVLRGDAEAALTEPNQIIVTESAAARYFGDADPMGQTLTRAYERGGQTVQQTLTVAAVMADPPPNSHLQFSLLASPGTRADITGGTRTTFQTGSYWWPGVRLYARLKPGADRAAAETQLRRRVDEGRRPEVAARYRVELQPLTEAHLGSTGLSRTATPPGSWQRVLVFGAIAVFVLLIAGVNFMNLATARAAERAQEVGVRKTLGASGSGLVRQFLGEALVVSTLAVLLALVLTALAVPVFEGVLGLDLAYGLWGNGPLTLGVLAVLLATGLGAGSYPALVLARFDPARALRDVTTAGGTRTSRLRHVLVVGQFALTVVLIVATTVAFQQLRYMQTARLGFDTEQVVAIEAEGDVATLARELERRPEVRQVTISDWKPGVQAGADFRYEVNGQSPDDPEERIQTQGVGFDFFAMMDVEVLAGRAFSAERAADRGVPFARDETHFSTWWRELPILLNRSAAEKFGWTPDEALDQTMRVYTVEGTTYYADVAGTVVGVVEDYHTRSLREAIPPTVYVPSALRTPGGGTVYFAGSFGGGYLLAKMAPGDAAQAMTAVEAVWDEVTPDALLDASFLNADLQQLYDAERRVGRVMGGFAGLAVLVACLGLVGLATYTAQQRTREIGIRKAVGASTSSIVGLLSKDFLQLVALAVLIASPVAYYLAEQWLQQFAYRITPGVGLFAGCTALVLVLAALAVGTQTLRAARTDPATVLRTE